MTVLTRFRLEALGLRSLLLFVMLATVHWSVNLCADEVRLFLLAGQSNMVSRNPNTFLIPPMDQPLPAVKIWKAGTQAWVDLQGGFGKFSSQFGPEVSFGHRLAEELSGDLRIVKVADGGTTLAEDWDPVTPSERQMYSWLMTDTLDAIASLETAGHSVKVAGMMWMQGESDTLDESMANAYQENLVAFIARVRSDLATPDMPFIIGRIHDELVSSGGIYADIVRAAQVSVAESDPWVDWIDTDSFQLQMDRIHYNAIGTLALGEAFAEAYLEMTGFRINPGLNDHWYNPLTDGQGYYITVFPNLGKVNLTGFTWDTEHPPQGATANFGNPNHRWFNALGPYDGNQAVMNIKIASGGLFDTPATEATVTRVVDGTIILTFDDCNSGTIEYDISSIGRTGIVPIQRIVGDNIVLCEAFNSTD